ncbi:MAG: DNA-binding protein WhiA [Firmicutes bacterium]|nr:DNA-binding protein WhiA [Bacillota bacterium]
MSFASKVKEDLARLTSNKSCCRKAELAAFWRTSGNVHFKDDIVFLALRTENTAVARRVFLLTKESGLTTQLSLERKAKLKKKSMLSLRVSPQPELIAFTNSLGITDEAGRWLSFNEHFTAQLTDNDCCKRAYLRGAYLATGYINRPEGDYHLEFCLQEYILALFLQKLLASFSINGKVIRRKGLIVLYLKEAEQISLLLNIMGSHRSLLEFESLRVDKELRNQVNRLVNCDKANVNKTVTASLNQIECLRLIEEKTGFNALTPSLKEVALLRLQYPEASLSELSDLSGLGRSAINHRLRRLVEIADEIKPSTYRRDNAYKNGEENE